MMITEHTKQVIPFRPDDAKRVGEGCFYLDLIVWLNGDRIELGDRVGFNYGCFVNGYGGLTIGDDCIFGPYVMIHTANHELDDPTRPAGRAGLARRRPARDRPQRVDRDGHVHPPGRHDRRGLRRRRGQRGRCATCRRSRSPSGTPRASSASEITETEPMRVLFLEQQPCIRALKIAVGLRSAMPGLELGFAYQGKSLTEWYGAGDETLRPPVAPDGRRAAPRSPPCWRSSSRISSTATTCRTP